MGNGDHLVLNWCVAIDDVERCSERLWQCGAIAIEERQDGKNVALVAGFENVAEVLIALRECEGSTMCVVEDGWQDAWKVHVLSYTVAGSITVVPAWASIPSDAASQVVIIDSGDSFGLAHVTTQICVEVLCGVIEIGSRVLDVGCGTGILSIVAAKLGAAAVTAIDIEPQAIVDTDGNLTRNALQRCVTASVDRIESIHGTFDVTVANLGGAQVLVSMTDHLRRVTKPDGWLVLGGLLDVNVAVCLDAFTWATEVARVHRDGWNVILLRPR